jgi:hypothetical protein
VVVASDGQSRLSRTFPRSFKAFFVKSFLLVKVLGAFFRFRAESLIIVLLIKKNITGRYLKIKNQALIIVQKEVHYLFH